MHRLPTLPSLTLLAGLLIALATQASAQQLSLVHDDGRQAFTQQQLLSLNPAELTTETPWTDGEQRFEGIYLTDLLAQAGIETGALAATALNGYSVDIPIEAAIAARAFIAVKANGDFMRVRDKGPFWIVFPWSAQSELETRTVRAWSIWQLVELVQAAP
ncbi:MAG: putative pterin-binding protein [Saccharospirillum sp.]